MLIWFHMKGLSNFFLGILLTLGFLGLTAAGIGALSDQLSNQIIKEVWAVNDDPDAVGCPVGCAVVNGKNMKCHTAKKDSAGNCTISGAYNCVEDRTCPQSTSTTTPTPQSTNSTRKYGSCESIPVVSGILQFLKVDDEKCVTKERAKWSEEGIFEGIGEAAFGDYKKNLKVLRGPDGKLDYSRADASELDTGVMGMLGTFTTQMIDSPPDIRTGSYFADLAPFKTVNAAGIDAISPSPIKAFWTAMRNVSYGLFVLILVAIGFMVMFRSKLDPRTTVTVTAALPNLVVSLVLITFSLVLAGLIVDLGSILIELVKNILSSQNLIINGNYVSTRPLDVLSNFSVRIYDTPLGTSFENLPIIGFLGKALFTAVIATVALFISFNIFFTLLFKWAAIMIKTIFAPLFFLWGALPGQGDTTTKWFKGFLSDVLTFPAVLLILNIANQIISTPAEEGMPFPPALGGTGDAGSGNYLPLVGLGVLLLATKVPAMIEEALDVKASGHVAKAGTDIQKAAAKTPLLGRFFG